MRELYADLGQPPGWLLRFWGRGAQGSSWLGARVGVAMLVLIWVNPGLGFVAVLVVAFIAGYPAAQLIRGACWLVGAPVQGVLSPYLVLGLAAVFVLLFVGFPGVWFNRSRALAPVRCAVHASFAATLPEHAGGPARCWSCGAALDVAPGALGVPCAYCRADNLVALPLDWVAKLRAADFQHFRSIDAALGAYREAGARAREASWKLVFGLIVVLPAVMLAAYVLQVLQISY